MGESTMARLCSAAWLGISVACVALCVVPSQADVPSEVPAALGEAAGYDHAGVVDATGSKAFRCLKASTTNVRRRRGGDAGTRCKLAFKHSDSNLDKNHDATLKPIVDASKFSNNNWLKECDATCDVCMAGLNLGIDRMNCCPDVTFDLNSPTDTQIEACRNRAQNTLTDSQLMTCGFVVAKCKTTTVWYYKSNDAENGLVQVLTGDSLASYESSYGNCQNHNGWCPWRFVQWKHSSCHFKKVGNDIQKDCKTSKRSTCKTPGNGLSCDNPPEAVMNLAAVEAGLF